MGIEPNLIYFQATSVTIPHDANPFPDIQDLVIRLEKRNPRLHGWGGVYNGLVQKHQKLQQLMEKQKLEEQNSRMSMDARNQDRDDHTLQEEINPNSSDPSAIAPLKEGGLTTKTSNFTNAYRNQNSMYFTSCNEEEEGRNKKIEDLGNEVLHLTLRAEQSERTVTLLKETVANRDEQIEILKEEIKNRDKEIDNRDKDIVSERSKYTNLFSEHEELVREYEGLSQENERLEKEKKKEDEEKKRQKERDLMMQPKTEVFIELASPSYEKDYLPLMEDILCKVFHTKCSQELYGKKKVREFSPASSSNIPPQGSTVLYVLILSSNRFDDAQKNKRLAALVDAGVNVIVCLFRASRVVYLEVEKIVVGENKVALKTFPFMVNQRKLSHNVSDLKDNERSNLLSGFSRSIEALQDQLLRHPPKGEYWFKTILDGLQCK